MESVPLLDCAGRRRSPATMSGFHQGLPPRNKGLRYPPDPPTVEEIIAVMRAAGDRADGAQAARRDRCAMADRAANQRSARACRRAISTGHAAPCWCAVARAASAARLGSTGGPASSSIRGPRSAPGCRSARSSACSAAHPRPSLLPIRDSRLTPQRRPRGRGASSVRAAPAPPHPRGQDEPRRSPAGGHPTPTRSRRPRDHLRLPTRHRQHRDHPRHPQAARTNDPSSQRTPLLALTRRPGRDDRQAAPHTKTRRS